MGTVQFNDSVVLFGDSAAANTDKVAMHADCCCGETVECEFCVDGTGPAEFAVTLNNFSNAGCGPGNCETLEDTFILTYQGGCVWEIDSGFLCTDIIRLTVSDEVVTVNLITTGLGPQVTFVKNFGATVDCKALSGESITKTYCNGMWGCDCSTSTCVVTAL